MTRDSWEGENQQGFQINYHDFAFLPLPPLLENERGEYFFYVAFVHALETSQGLCGPFHMPKTHSKFPLFPCPSYIINVKYVHRLKLEMFYTVAADGQRKDRPGMARKCRYPWWATTSKSGQKKFPQKIPLYCLYCMGVAKYIQKIP